MACTNSLLLRFDDLPTAAAPVDSSDNPIICSYVGATSIRARSPERYAIRSSCYFASAAGDYVSITDDSSLHLDGDFTIDFSFQFDDPSLETILFGPLTDDYDESLTLKWDTTLATDALVLSSMDDASSPSLRYYTVSIVQDTWYHIAITRESGVIRLYIDGALTGGRNYTDHVNNNAASNTWTQAQNYNQDTGMKIGVIGSGGYIDEFSIIKDNVPSPFDSDFYGSLPNAHCGVTGCTDRDAFNYNPAAHIESGTCAPATYWNTSDVGIVFKAHGHTGASAQSDTIKVQSLQRDVWTKINFRNEHFDTSGQYFPAISTFKPTIAGRYNIKAQIQIKDVLADTPNASEEHRIIIAIFKDNINIEQALTVVEHYHPNDPKEDTTVSVETIIDLSTEDILDGNNEFTAHVYIEGLEESEIDDKYCSSIGCTASAAVNTVIGATVDDGSCAYAEGCTDPYYKEYWDNVTNEASSVDFPNDDDCHVIAILGCTAASDANYNADANVDDGSCEGSP